MKASKLYATFLLRVYLLHKYKPQISMNQKERIGTEFLVISH